MVWLVAPLIGLLIAAQDYAAPFGDDSAKVTILLWLGFSGLLGFLDPTRPWLLALLIGPWLPLMYLVLQAAKLFTWPPPNVGATGFILIPVSLAVCLVGSYAGAWIRKLSSPESPAANTAPSGQGS
jgi:hypothetical protein